MQTRGSLNGLPTSRSTKDDISLSLKLTAAAEPPSRVALNESHLPSNASALAALTVIGPPPGVQGAGPPVKARTTVPPTMIRRIRSSVPNSPKSRRSGDMRNQVRNMASSLGLGAFELV